MRPAAFLPIVAAVAFAACTPGAGARPAHPGEADRPPVPLLIWDVTSFEDLSYRLLLFAAMDDGSIIFRAPKSGEYYTFTDSALVRRLYGTESERAEYAALRDVRMPRDWQRLDGGAESVCLRVDGEMRCHHISNPEGEHVGRPDACAWRAQDTVSYHGHQSWVTCRRWNAAHAALPATFATYYRRIYDVVQGRAEGDAPWEPRHPLFIMHEVDCSEGPRRPWPRGVPRPRDGERSDSEGGTAWYLPLTAEQARLLNEVGRGAACLTADGSGWGWLSSFRLPPLETNWSWQR